ncbi:MAG: hypothetical protein AABZ32_01525 [Bacteroidota bacterium]
MKNKREIKKEIYELAKKISEAHSDDDLLAIARELHEKSVLLKHSSAAEPQVVVKPEEQIIGIAEESIKPDSHSVIAEKKQVAIDLFSSETVYAERSAPKELKEIKKKSDPDGKIGAGESVAEKLQHKKIADLKASIGINEKFQFINELFEGNMKEYNVAIDQINRFISHSEAVSYIANLQEVYKWKEDNLIATNFHELVKRRFF